MKVTIEFTLAEDATETNVQEAAEFLEERLQGLEGFGYFNVEVAPIEE